MILLDVTVKLVFDSIIANSLHHRDIQKIWIELRQASFVRIVVLAV